ncbi:MAG: FkbM family methyltransferase [Arenimonas sp.]
MTLKHRLRTWLWTFGYDVVRFRPDVHPLARRRELLQTGRFDTVLDVGANAGQYARQLRKDLGYAGRIVSFEPLSTAYAELSGHARRDPAWTTVHCALGAVDGTAQIQVAGNSYSSSLLDMLPAHLDAAPQSARVDTETVTVRRLDAIIDDLCPARDRLFLKIDVQGFEPQVLDGAASTLPRVQALQVEMSLVPLYAGEPTFAQMHDRLQDLGFALHSLEPGFAHPRTGQLLQVDGVYVRPGVVAAG